MDWFGVEMTDSSMTGTRDLGASTTLVSGTAVYLAGSDLNLTSPVSPVMRVTIRRLPSRSIERYSSPVVSRRHSASRKRRGRTVNAHELTATFPRSVQMRVPGMRTAVDEKPARVARGAEAAPVKLIGKDGSSLRPGRKYYDVDLDEYQL